jgi:hypothetical protein|tara:strand:- start:44 stop:406 length:363 start_codon:yes stop_codon:yes gene_type:complete
MATFEEAVKAWADTINDWYSLDTTAAEVSRAFNEAFKDRTTFDDHGQDGASYIETFFKCKDGSWSDGLDTADREELANTIEYLRGNDPLPTYADLGGNLLNVVPCRRSEIVDPFGQPEET